MLEHSEIKNENKLTPLRKFAKDGQYSAAYLSILVQRKKLKAKKVGRNYYTTKEWFDAYLRKHAQDNKKEVSSLKLDKKYNFNFFKKFKKEKNKKSDFVKNKKAIKFTAVSLFFFGLVAFFVCFSPQVAASFSSGFGRVFDYVFSSFEKNKNSVDVYNKDDIENYIDKNNDNDFIIPGSDFVLDKKEEVIKKISGLVDKLIATNVNFENIIEDNSDDFLIVGFSRGNDDKGQVAGVSEGVDNGSNIKSKLLALANTVAVRGKQTMATIKYGAYDVLENTADAQIDLSISFGEKVAKLALAGAEKIEGISDHGSKKLALLGESISKTNFALKDYSESGENIIKQEWSRSLLSLSDMYSKAVDFIMPDSIKNKYAQIYTISSSSSSSSTEDMEEKGIETVEKYIVYRDVVVSSTDKSKDNITENVAESDMAVANVTGTAFSNAFNISGNADIDGNLNVSGDIYSNNIRTNEVLVNGGSEFGGEMIVGGSVRFDRQFSVLGGVDLIGGIYNSEGDLEVDDNMDVAMTLTTRNLRVTDWAEFHGRVNMSDLEVDGLEVREDLSVAGDAVIQGSETIYGDLYVDGTMMTNHLTLNSLGISGIGSAYAFSSGDGGLSSSGDVYLRGDENYISGIVNLSNILNIDYNASNALTVGGTNGDKLVVDTIDDHVNITANDIFLNGTTNMTGTVDLTGALTLTGSAELTGTTTIDGDLTLNGFLDVNTATTSAATIGDGTDDNLVVDTLNDIITINSSQLTINNASSTTGIVVNNNGTGNLLQIKDNGIARFELADFGGITQTASTTGYAYNLNQAATGSGIFNFQDEGIDRLTLDDWGVLTQTASTSVGYAFSLNQNGEGGNIFNFSDNGVSRFAMSDFGVTTLTASSTNTAFVIRQDDSGDILNLYDGTNNVLTVADGGNVGIGTTTPTSMLDVIGTAHLRGASDQVGLYVSSAGYVGAGTSTPNSILHLNGTLGTLSGGLSFGNGDSGVYELSDDNLVWQTAGVDRLAISDVGYVGIGTTTPAVKLHIDGIDNKLRLSQSSDIYSDIYTDTNGDLVLEPSGGDVNVVGNLIPVPGSSRTVGDVDNYWRHGYFDELTVNVLGVASTTVAGTLTSDFKINSDATDDEDSTLTFYRGSTLTGARLSWEADNDQFTFNYAVNSPSFIASDTATLAGDSLVFGGVGDITMGATSTLQTTAGLLTLSGATGITHISTGGAYTVDATGQIINITGGLTTLNTSQFDLNNTGAITLGIDGNEQDITFESNSFDINAIGDVTIDGANFVYTPTGTYTINSTGGRYTLNAVGQLIDMDSTTYILETTGNATTTVGGVYNIDSVGAVTINSDAGISLSGASLSLTTDGGNLTLTYPNGQQFQLTDGITRIETLTDGQLVLGDDTATTTIDGLVISVSGNTVTTGTMTQNITDNTANAFLVKDVNNHNFIDIDTDTEMISFGNLSINPTFSFIGTGATILGGDLNVSGNATTTLNQYIGGNLTVGGVASVSGNLNMNNNLILNIGDAGTDFDSSGGLTLAGNLDVNGSVNDMAGTLNLSGNNLTSSEALTITPAAGNNLNIDLSTSGNFAVNTNQLYVDTSLGNVGIGTATPTATLDVAGVGFFLPAGSSEVSDEDLDNSQWTMWLDESADEFELKAKKSDGTVISQSIKAGAGEYAVYQDHQAEDSATSTGSVWTTRTLNTTIAQSGDSIFRTGNTITLTAGTYRIKGNVFAYNTYHTSRFQNITDGTTAISGDVVQKTTVKVSGKIYTASGSQSILDGVITITDTKTFELQGYTSDATYYPGVDVGFAEDNIYASIFIQKLSATTPASQDDNLGNHIATQNIHLDNFWLSGDGGDEGLFIASNGNVGIGDNTPSSQLSVVSLQTTTPTLTLTGIADQTADYFQIKDSADLQLLTVDSSGNVGIGTATPSTALDVSGTVTATAFVGDGSGLTGVTSNQEDFIATGTISTGDLIAIRSDGTVEVVSGETTEEEVPVEIPQEFGTSVVFESAQSYYNSAVYDSATGKVVIAYKDGGNSNYGTAIVGTVSGTSISFGTPVVFKSAITSYISTTYDSATGKVVIAYRDSGNSDYGTAVVGTVSGTSISFGGSVVFKSATISDISTTYDSATGKVVIAYQDGGNSNYGTAVVGTVSGTSISFGTPVVFESANIAYTSTTYDSATGKVVIAYRNSSTWTSRAVVGTVSGTSISFGSPVVFKTSMVSYISTTYDSATGKVVIAYRDNSPYGTAVVGTVSGDSISFGSPVVFESADTGYISTTYDSVAGKVVIAYRDDGNSSYGTAVVGTVSGTSISFDTPVVFESSISAYTAATYDSNTEKVILAYSGGGSTYGAAVVMQLGYTSTTTESTTTSNYTEFIGIAQNDAADTETCTVGLSGFIDENQTGLSTSDKYYVTELGAITTTETAVEIGTALSATNLWLSNRSGDTAGAEETVSSQWTENGSNIYFSTGSVGIGDSSPSSLLTVGADDAFQINNLGQVVSGTWQGSAIGTNYLNSSVMLESENISLLTNDLGFITASTTDTFTNKSGSISMWTNDAGYITDGNTNWDNTYNLITASDTLTGLVQSTAAGNSYFTGGNVGIGKTDPATALDVSGTVTATAFAGDGSGLSGVGVGEFIDSSIAISSDDSALANDDGTNNNNIGIGYNAGNALTSGYYNLLNGFRAGENISTGFYNIGLGSSALFGSSSAKLTGSYNIGIGHGTGYHLTTGAHNIGIGYHAGYSLTTGEDNVLIGQNAGANLTTGNYNVLSGRLSGYQLTTGNHNILNGYYAGNNITTSSNNIALGELALFGDSVSRLTGNDNIGIGYRSGYSLTTGHDNVLSGQQAGYNLTTGNYNTLSGYAAGYSITTSSYNVALGQYALYGDPTSQLTGSGNIGIGYRPGYNLTTGGYNVINGYNAGFNLTSGSYNVLSGSYAGGNITTSSNNIALGQYALYGDSVSKLTGAGNIGIGYFAGYNLTTGGYNTLNGYNAGHSLTSGSYNSLNGYQSGHYMATGDHNIGIGYYSLRGDPTSKLTGNNNIGFGYYTGHSLTTGYDNILSGQLAGYSLTTGSYNVLSGSNAGKNLTTGNNNIFSGHYAGYNVSTGYGNVGIGEQALYGDTTSKLTGSHNIGIGYNTGNNLTTGYGNALLGYDAGSAITTGHHNSIFGYNAGDTLTTGNYNLIIGYNAQPSSATVSNEITLGNSSVTTIRAAVTSITALSDRRYKKNIQDLNAGLTFINSLRPVTFNWLDEDMDPRTQNGFIAQEVQASVAEYAAGELDKIVLTENPDRLELTQGELFPATVKAIQELSIQVNSIEDLDLNNQITEIEENLIILGGTLEQQQQELTSLETQLTVQADDLSGKILNNEDSISILIDSITNLESNLTLVQEDIANFQTIFNETMTELKNAFIIDENGNIKMGNNISTTTQSVAIVEINTASTTKQTAFVINQAGQADIADFQANQVSIMNIDHQGKVSVVGEFTVDGRIMACSGGYCGETLDKAVDETMGDIGVEGKVVAGAFEGYCEDGFVWVRGSAKYGTMPGFCVMDDKAKQNSDTEDFDFIDTENNTTWTNISQGEAQLACQTLGNEYHLISENEWMTITENITKMADNDIATSTDGMQLATTTAEYLLTNYNTINNLAGEIGEWTDKTITKNERPTTDNIDWTEYYDVSDYGGLNIAPAYYLSDEANNIGKIKIGDSEENLRGFVRGFGGIYGLDLSNSPMTATTTIGFRCAK